MKFSICNEFCEGWRIEDVFPGRAFAVCTGGEGEWRKTADWLPVLTDPATFGCLQALVEEVLGFPVCVYVPRIARMMDRPGYLIESAHDHGASLATADICETRAAAFVAVLEAAA